MGSLQPRYTKPEWLYDQLAAASWSLLVGAPLFVLHMITLDYEHKMHGMVMSFSTSMTLSDIFRLHPLSRVCGWQWSTSWLWLFVMPFDGRHKERIIDTLGNYPEALIK